MFRVLHPILLIFARYIVLQAARWCKACVTTADFDEGDGLMVADADGGVAVSIMNKRLLAMTNFEAMSFTDWIALLLCSYLVGLTIAGEIAASRAFIFESEHIDSQVKSRTLHFVRWQRNVDCKSLHQGGDVLWPCWGGCARSSFSSH
eukprot:SAG31_NODE_8281_length_1481_cov_1.415340_3_plen_148_part_00